MKKIVIIVIIALIAFIIYSSTKTKGTTDELASLILFHGDGCPHCKVVDEYITQNNVNDKIKIAYHEVYYNKTNQNLLTDTVKKCPEIDSSQGVGVPLAYDKANNKCLYGDTPIIDWLKAQMVK